MLGNHTPIPMCINKEIEQTITAKQKDARSRYLDIYLLNDNGTAFDLAGCKARFNARKTDGKTIFNDCTIINATAGFLRVELTDQTLAIGDRTVLADISIFSGDGREILTTRTFGIYVEAMIRDDFAIESSNEYGTIVVLIQEVYDMKLMLQKTMEDYNAWFATIGQNITKLQVFDFDNLAALDKVSYIVKFNGAVTTETTSNRLSGKTIATRRTEFIDNKAEEVIQIFADDGHVMKESKITTTFGADGTITSTVDGYNDYSLNAAYLSEIRVDGGTF